MTTLTKLSSKLFQSFKLWKSLGTVAIFICTFAYLHINTFAQNVGISATGATPDNSAMLDVTSTTKGMLIPRMTGDEKYAIPSPVTGLLIFQTDTVGFWYYEGSKWIPLLSSTSSTSGSTGGWGLSGNGNTSASNFLGTTDNISLRIKTNDTTRVIVDSLGRVGIGKTNPAYKLDILDSNSAGSGVISRTLNLSQTRTEANITATTYAYGINNSLLYRMTEGTPGTQGLGYAANNVAYTDGAYTFNHLRGANNTAYTTSTASTNQTGLFGAINSGYLNSSGTVTTGSGAYNQAYNNSSGTITNALGATNYAFTNAGASGTITKAYGSTNQVNNLSTAGGSITQAIGVQSSISKVAAASVIPTGYLYYGHYPTAGAVTNPWGIYLTGEANNYFSGNVGIGTSSPAVKLTSYSSNASDNSTTELIRVHRYTPDKVNDQGVGIGFYIEDPNNNTIDPNARISSFILDGGSVSGEKSGGLKFDVNNNDLLSTALTILPSGNVGIGTPSPSYKLEVCGTIATTAVSVTTNISCSSDIRYKKDITPLPNALNNVMKLQGVNYHWKTDAELKKDGITNISFSSLSLLGRAGEGLQLGFIAQDLEKIFPEVVMTDKEGYKSVDYSRLTPILVEAIKEQQKTIGSMQLAMDKLESENKGLKANTELEITKLKAAVEKLMQAANTEEVKK